MVGFDYEELVKATERFSSSRLVGKGSHGSVYKGILEDHEPKIVAVKKSSSPSVHSHDHLLFNDNLKKLDNEIDVLSSLNENPFVINFLGTSSSHDSAKNDKLLVMEFMPNGSLYDLLHVDSSTPLTWPKRVEIAIQVARGIRFLHENKPLVIHRDIKSANILFDSNWKPKLADFGLAVSTQQLNDNDEDSPSQVIISTQQQPAGTLGYLDPCYTTPNKLSTKNDVFSFGVVLLEIISNRKAIDVSKSPASIVEWAVPLIEDQKLMMSICDKKISLPSYMEGIIKQLLNVAARCVSFHEENRPSIMEVVMEIENCLFVKRVKSIPIWVSLTRRVILMRKRRKLAKKLLPSKCATQEADVHCKISAGRVLLREILAT